jgi:DNA repair protein RecN (Recombination protein N)
MPAMSGARLRQLSVRNLAVIASVDLEVDSDFTAITGETGAGKSLLLDALGLVTGGRAHSRLIGPEDDAAMVIADFEIPPSDAWHWLTEEFGIRVDDTLLLRRRIRTSGRNQAWINDEPVSVAALTRIGQQLVEIAGQHEHLLLSDWRRQAEWLDAAGGLVATARAFRAADERYRRLVRELEQLSQGSSDSLRERDYLRYVVDEIDAIDPKPGELAAITTENDRLGDAQHWRSLLAHGAEELVDGDQALITRLQRVAGSLLRVPDEAVAAAAGDLQHAIEYVRSAGLAAEAAQDRFVDDPERLAEIGDRLQALDALVRKHGGSEESLLAVWSEAAERLQELAGLEERREQLGATLDVARAERDRTATLLREQRESQAAVLCQRLQAELADLGMPQVRMRWCSRAAAAELTSDGYAQQFVVSTNPGMDPGPLGTVLSGGECARVALAMAVVGAPESGAPVLVLDEIEAGVGGRLGAVLADKLASISACRMLLTITHVPQVAARADAHIRVIKQQEPDSTTVNVERLESDKRVAELAAMFGGGAGAMQQAQELLTQRSA